MRGVNVVCVCDECLFACQMIYLIYSIEFYRNFNRIPYWFPFQQHLLDLIDTFNVHAVNNGDCKRVAFNRNKETNNQLKYRM